MIDFLPFLAVAYVVVLAEETIDSWLEFIFTVFILLTTASTYKLPFNSIGSVGSNNLTT